jgi:hypothetical protein
MWHNDLNQEITAFEKHVFDKLSMLDRRTLQMAINTDALAAAVAKIGVDTTTLIALAQTAINNQGDPTLQGKLDTLTASLSTTDQAIATELASAAGPTGTTGASGTTGATGA